MYPFLRIDGNMSSKAVKQTSTLSFTLEQYLTVLQPWQAFSILLFPNSTCSLPLSSMLALNLGSHRKHCEHVSFRWGESRAHARGRNTRNISSPDGIALDKNSPLPASRTWRLCTYSGKIFMVYSIILQSSRKRLAAAKEPKFSPRYTQVLAQEVVNRLTVKHRNFNIEHQNGNRFQAHKNSRYRVNLNRK